MDPKDKPLDQFEHLLGQIPLRQSPKQLGAKIESLLFDGDTNPKGNDSTPSIWNKWLPALATAAAVVFVALAVRPANSQSQSDATPRHTVSNNIVSINQMRYGGLENGSGLIQYLEGLSLIHI